jgi:hypothetical protein
MMTLNQAERLVRKIAEAGSQPASDTQTAKLAQDYAEVCRAANRRLEQCAIMIEAGQFLQALQLAETPPPLLDLITLLAFRQAADWRAYCQAHQLPWPEPFYDKYIRLLNNAYGKGIASDHPFYRDYRRAVMENDDARALSILRVISRLNPSDTNTKEELKRVEEKLLRVKLESLGQVVAAGDAGAIEAGLEQLEAAGLPVPASHPTWQQAQVARCRQMLRVAEQLREQDNWQEVESLVEEIQTLANRFTLRLPDAEADIWKALEEWSAEHRAAFAADQDFQRAVSALEYEFSSVASQRATDARLNKAAATAAYETLEGKWREAQRFDGALPEGMVDRYKECGDWLRDQVKAAQRRRRLAGVAIFFTIFCAIGVASPYFLRSERQRDFSQKLQRLESVRQVSEVEKLLTGVPDSWKANPKTAEDLNKARDFVAREKELKRSFDQKLAGLQNIAASGFRNALEQPGPDRGSCEQALNLLAPEYRSAARSALGEWDDKWQTFRNHEIGGMLTEADAAAENLNGTNGVESVRASMAQIRTKLSGLAPLEAQPPALEPGLLERISALSNKVEIWTATTEKWEEAQAAVSHAGSLQQYLTALDQMVVSPFATPAQREAVKGIGRLQIDQETLLGQLLLPNNPSTWPSLTNVTGWSLSLMPEQPTSHEKDLYFKLRDNKNAKDVYAYELITNSRPGNPYHSHPVFVQGAIAPNNAGDEAGIIHDPALYQDSLHFVPTSYSDWNYIKIQRLYRMQECDTYERLGLGELIDANTGNYQKPILQLFDQLNAETKASAVFRAFVTFKLLAVAQVRPDEWGFPWCPSAAAHIQALTELGAKDIQSGDWMVPERSDKFDGPLQKYFAQARTIPLEKQARFLQQLVQGACEKGFSYAGFVDASGRVILESPSLPPAELCGWSKSGSVAVLFHKSASEAEYTSLAEPLPYTPLFAVAGDRHELLLQTLTATGYPAALARPVLPPFFKGAL